MSHIISDVNRCSDYSRPARQLIVQRNAADKTMNAIVEQYEQDAIRDAEESCKKLNISQVTAVRASSRSAGIHLQGSDSDVNVLVSDFESLNLDALILASDLNYSQTVGTGPGRQYVFQANYPNPENYQETHGPVTVIEIKFRDVDYFNRYLAPTHKFLEDLPEDSKMAIVFLKWSAGKNYSLLKQLIYEWANLQTPEGMRGHLMYG